MIDNGSQPAGVGATACYFLILLRLSMTSSILGSTPPGL